ncbi:MAG: hypothetical protein ABSD59_21645, partial [Terracidiphilus sp.]
GASVFPSYRNVFNDFRDYYIRKIHPMSLILIVINGIFRIDWSNFHLHARDSAHRWQPLEVLT